MAPKATMRSIVEGYLHLRRKLGFQLRIEGEELLRFAHFADQSGHAGPITTELAVRWATLPKDAAPLYHARRLDMVRRVAQHRAASDTRTAIPPQGLLGPSYRRPQPHIYSEAQIRELLKAASELTPKGKEGLRPFSYKTLFGLLASTGMRISEALKLTRNTVDLQTGVILIPIAKFHRARLVPLHQSVLDVLRAYARQRDRHRRHSRSDAFLINEHGTSLKYQQVIKTFVGLRRQLGWSADQHGRLPRIHDLRHTFVVRRLLRWCEQGANLDNKVAALSTYLGHVHVTGTYWYLTGVPELLAVTARRFERYGKSRGGR